MTVESRINTYVILLQIAKFPCIALHAGCLRGRPSSWSSQQFVVNLLYFCQLGRWEMVSQFNFLWTSLVVQRVNICLLTQGTRVWSLVWEDLSCHKQLSRWARTTGPACWSCWSPRAQSMGAATRSRHCGEACARSRGPAPSNNSNSLKLSQWLKLFKTEV